MSKFSTWTALSAMLLIPACTTVPNGPSAMALPGSGKDFEQFRSDDNACRQYSLSQSNGTSASQAANNSFAETAVLGTIIGTAIGAAAGGHEGAAIGAGTGLLFGSLEGSNAAGASAYGVQQRYDNAYIQCMYSKGHRVPVSGRFETQPRPVASPPQRYLPPPPPPGYTPPPAPSDRPSPPPVQGY